MRWLMPFDGRWSYGDVLFIVDPWFWLILGGAVFLNRSRRLWSLLAWSSGAGLASYGLWALIPGLAAAKAMWLGGIAACLLLRAARVGATQPAAGRLAGGALVTLALYIAAMTATAGYARRAVAEELAARELVTEALMVAPVPVTPFVRDLVATTQTAYFHGSARLFPRFELELDPPLPRLELSAPVAAALAAPEVRGFVHWARFPFARVERHATGCTVYLLDARYARAPGVGFGAARVEVPAAALRPEPRLP
jgi:inner membrane protein